MSRNVIFDLGGVLIDWDPRHSIASCSTAMPPGWSGSWAKSATMPWHLQHDAGRPFAETTAELKLKYPGHDTLIDAFATRHEEMFAGTIPGSVALLERLAAAGVPLYAITNFPAETFPIAERKFAFLALFRDIAVSGRERVLKPSAELFNILLRRNSLTAADFDLHRRNSIKNVDAARALGLHAIHFTSADVLETELQSLGVPHA